MARKHAFALRIGGTRHPHLAARPHHAAIGRRKTQARRVARVSSKRFVEALTHHHIAQKRFNRARSLGRIGEFIHKRATHRGMAGGRADA